LRGVVLGDVVVLKHIPRLGGLRLGLALMVAVGGGVVAFAYLAGGSIQSSGESDAAVPSPRIVGADVRGEPAPDFALNLIDGGRFVLSRHLATDGRPVLLNFWASWCVPCRREMPVLDAASRRFPGVYFLGVAVEDDPVAALAFIREVAVSYPLAIDEKDVMLAMYPILGLPTTFLISPRGEIVSQLTGELSAGRIDDMISSLAL